MKNNTNKTCRWLSPDFPVENLPDLFCGFDTLIFTQHVPIITHKVLIQKKVLKSQDIFIYIYICMINTLHKDNAQLYKYTRKDMDLVSSSPYPGVVLCQTLPVVSVTDSFVTTQAPPFSSPQNDPSPSSSPTPPSPQLAPPPAQCTCRTEVSPQVHLSPAIFFHMVHAPNAPASVGQRCHH